MAKIKFPADQTICVDDCICVQCGNNFDGRTATDGDMDCLTVTCPKCHKEMYVSISVEYMCTAIED